MIGRTVRSLVHLIGGLVAGLSIMLAALAWKLSAGPLSLAFLTPYVEAVLRAPDGSFLVKLEDTVLTWGGWRRTLDVRIVNLQVIGRDGAPIARVPEVSMSLSAQALAHGLIAPRGIELFRPQLRLVRHENGRLEIGFDGQGPGAAAFAELVLAALEGRAGPDNPMAYLARLVIADADLSFEDRRLGMAWQAPSTDIALARDENGVRGEMSFDLQIEGAAAHVGVVGIFRSRDGSADLGISFGAISPAVFARLAPGLAGLGAVDVPLQGTVTVSLRLDGGPETASFDLTGGAGRIVFGTSFIDDVWVEGIAIRGRLDGPRGELVVDELSANLGAAGVVFLPTPTDHEMPVRAARGHGRYLIDQRRIEVARLDLDLGGPSLTATGTIEGLGETLSGKIDGELRNVPIDDLRRYWPRAWGRNPHDWSAIHLSEGTLRTARAGLSFRVPSNGPIEIVSLGGTMDLENVTVDYLPPMPKARRVHGRATFDRSRMDIAVSAGQVMGLGLQRGSIALTGLDVKDQFADIDLAIEGPLRDAIELIENKPLGFASVVGIDPAKVGGVGATRLKLHFILEHRLTIDQVQVSAAARLRDVSLADAPGGLTLDRGQFDLEVDKRTLLVKGRADLGSIPVELSWRESFAGAPERTRYEIRGRIDDRQRVEGLKLDFAPFTPEFLSGPVAATVVYALDGARRGHMQASLDLRDARLALPGFAWQKAEGIAGSAVINLRTERNAVVALDRFHLEAGDLMGEGSAAFGADGRLDRVAIDRLRFGRNDLGLTLAARDGGSWAIVARGVTVDLAPILAEMKNRPAPEPKPPGPRFAVEADIERIWLAPERGVTKVRGPLVNDGERWERVELRGQIEDGKSFELTIAPKDKAARSLALRAEDAGGAFRAMDFYDNMIGGTLDVQGTYDDSRPTAPLAGRIRVDNYRILRAPLLTRVLSIMALTGVVEALQGEGLSFTVLDAPFVLEEGVIDLAEARASGPSLGFTASGKVDTRREQVDLEGTVVPAYAINSLLGRIPMIGQIFTGERGSGVFAATYRMAGPTADPRVTVNPLSALAPGFLRRLFGILGGGETPGDGAKPNGETPESR